MRLPVGRKGRSPRITTLALVLAACGDATGPTSAPTVDLSGEWTYSHAVSDPSRPCPVSGSPRCSESGRLSLVQSGSALSGTLTGRGGCESCDVAIDYSGVGRAEGSLRGSVLSLVLTGPAAICRYEGTASATAASGTATCQGVTASYTGRFELRRP